jgi:hypothetical protein
VLALDGAGATVARTVSDQRGQFRLAASPSVRRIRALRIGFRPREIDAPPAVVGVTQLELVLTAIPTLLEPVQVRAGATCPRRADRAAAFALLEQARAGLLATIVAREANPVALLRLVYVRTMDGTSDRIVKQTVRIDSAQRMTTSFDAARSARTFVEKGFAETGGEEQTFFGPDAEALLDDAFANGYCFRIADRDRARPGQIGLGFAAASRARDRVDIDGTLWIDSVARALRDVEFRYVGLDRRLEDLEPGGHIFFREIGNGVVLIDRWFLRLVAAEVDSARESSTWPSSSTRPIGNRQAPPTRFTASESGGEVARAAWPDGFTWRAELGTVRGVALDQDGRPAGGVVIGLDGTDYRAISASNGRFEISNLLPGPYVATIEDTALAPLGIAVRTSLTFTTHRDSVFETKLSVPTTAQYVADACRATGPKNAKMVDVKSAWLVGRVLTPDGTPVRRAHVTLTRRGADGLWFRFGDEIVTGSDGLFTYCDLLPPRRDIVVNVKRDDRPAQTTRVELGGAGTVTVVRVEIPPTA